MEWNGMDRMDEQRNAVDTLKECRVDAVGRLHAGIAHPKRSGRRIAR